MKKRKPHPATLAVASCCAALLLAFAGTAFAAEPPPRTRGTIERLDGDTPERVNDFGTAGFGI